MSGNAEALFICEFISYTYPHGYIASQLDLHY